MKIAVLIITILFTSYFSPAQLIPAEKSLKKEDIVNKIDSIIEIYSYIDNLPDSFKIQTYFAISHYPELVNTKIIFREKKIRTTMATRPRFDFIFKKRNKRTYIIYINNSSKKINGAIISEVPFNAQVGVIGHEFAHILDFSNKNGIRILGNGIGYLFKKFKIKLEYQTDSTTIAHGLGWQVYDFSDYILNRAEIPEKYINYKKKIYMSPNEIKKIILKLEK
ncbi:MAG: hypothetical protein KAT68_03170 [Bacteroidales bacterium]|nr:hypothetical protein [Bacteroidales bacterium]